MAKVEGYIGSLQLLARRLNKIVDVAVTSSSKEIADAIRTRLYGFGIDGVGVPLKPYHADTITRKKKKGQKTSNTTLRDSGAWYSGIFATSSNAIVTITSKDIKNPKLVEVYGENILTLNELEQKEILENAIDRQLQIEINKIDNVIELDF